MTDGDTSSSTSTNNNKPLTRNSTPLLQGHHHHHHSRGSSLTRGYTALELTGEPTVTGASTSTNVLVKKLLPARGIVTSNPKRAERLLARSGVANVKVHTDSGWGVKIWTFFFDNIQFFCAVVPIGSTGAGFAFFEMYAAGAQAILRFGAGSDRERSSLPKEIVVVDQATNLDGLLRAAGQIDGPRSKILNASNDLVALITSKAAGKQMPMKKKICYNVEDYHAYNFSELFESRDIIQKSIQSKQSMNDKPACWDMETGALYWRATQFGLHAVTVLVPLKPDPAMEREYYHVMLESLHNFSARAQGKQEAEGQNLLRSSVARHTRATITDDLIGVEDPYFASIDDVETGNGLFNTDSG